MSDKDDVSEEAKDKPLKDFVEAFPIGYGYAFLVFCGALYFHFYYNAFHIPIFRYLDISEIAVSFLPIIIVIIVFFGFFIGAISFLNLLLSLINLFLGYFKSRVSITRKNLPFVSYAQKNEFVQSLWIVILCSLCATYLYFANRRLDKFSDEIVFNDLREYYWYGFLIISAFFLPLATFRNKIISIAIIFVMAVVFESMSDVQEYIIDAKIKNKSYTIITTESDTIVTNRNYYFIGRTNNYVFLFNSSTKSYDDIPMNRIRKIYFEYQRK